MKPNMANARTVFGRGQIPRRSHKTTGYSFARIYIPIISAMYFQKNIRPANGMGRNMADTPHGHHVLLGGLEQPYDFTLSPSQKGEMKLFLPPITKVVLPMVNSNKHWYSPRHRHHPPCYDRNLESYGDTDLGEPLQAPFAGYIETARDLGRGWGNVIRIVGYEKLGEGIDVRWWAWLGAHWDEMYVKVGQIVEAGALLGTLGRSGLNPSQGAHLHEQISCGLLPPVTVLGGKGRWHWISCDRFYQDHGIDAALLEAISQHDGR